MKPENPAVPSSGLILDVVAPAPAASPEVPLAEPSKEATLVEAPAEVPTAPKAPATSVANLAKELPVSPAKSTAAVVKAAAPETAQHSAKPVFAVTLAVVLFMVLAAVALYAYSKSA